MSPRFWLFTAASAGTALVSGLGLGLYATTPPRVAVSDVEAPYPAPAISETQPDPASLNGPTEVRCTGCGPTLTQRQMAAMMGGGWDGYDDPAVRDYMAQDYRAEDDAPLPSADAPSPPAQRLPANIERFAAGESDSPQPVQMAQGSAIPSEDASTATGVIY